MSRLCGFWVVCSLALCCHVAPAADWPHWRGPNQNGITEGGDAFGEKPFALELAWGRPLGIAYSGISVADGRVVTMFADGEQDYLVALDPGSGDELWRYRIDTMFPSKGGSEGGPVSVPSIDGDTVYGLGAKGHLFAVNLKDGSEVWSLRIDEKLGARPPHFGFTTAPLVVDGVLFVQTGGDGGRSLTGFDKKTGEVLWSTGDDTVHYQNPVLTELAGREQIVAVTDQSVSGLVPATGEVLWTREHELGEQGGQSPVPLGKNRFLLAGLQGTRAYEVVETDGGYSVEELWLTTELKGSFATPVSYEGHIYGFSGAFLTCISPDDGERVWKSRPPGGHGLILVDGHLVILDGSGAVVVAEASPGGYREKARLSVAERSSYTYPSFADDTIFVRTTRDIAGVRIAHAVETAAGDPGASPAHAFEAFVRRVDGSENKRLLVDEFMSSQASFPIVEDERLVHFVYRGDVEDVAVTGSMTELRQEEGLRRIDGTDLHYGTYAIEAGARWEYRFNVDFDNSRPDPLNSRRVRGSRGDMSELVMRGHTLPEHIRPYDGPDSGRVETFELESEILGNQRKVHVYLPPGYDDGDRSFPLVILNDGEGWRDLAYLPNSLNNLIGRSLSPVIAVFVEQVRRAARHEFGGKRSDDYVRMQADELVPYLDGHYRTRREARSRAVIGAGSGAMMAVHAVLERPEVFGMAGGLSPNLPDPLGGRLVTLIEQATEPSGARFRIIWNRYGWRRSEWDLDLAADGRRIHAALESSGYHVSGGEALDADGWGGWRAQVGDVLENFFPR